MPVREHIRERPLIDLIENGTSPRHIKTLLGPASARTIQIYTTVSQGDQGRIHTSVDALGWTLWRIGVQLV